MNTFKRCGLVLAAMTFTLNAWAIELNTEEQKLGYIIGMDIGKSLRDQGTEVDLEAPVRAVDMAGAIDEQAVHNDVEMCLLPELANDTLFLGLARLPSPARHVPVLVAAFPPMLDEKDETVSDDGTVIAYRAIQMYSSKSGWIVGVMTDMSSAGSVQQPISPSGKALDVPSRPRSWSGPSQCSVFRA